MQLVEEYHEVNKKIETLQAEVKSLSMGLKRAEPTYKSLSKKRESATKFFSAEDALKIKSYEELVKSLPEKKKELEEIQKQAQKRIYDEQSKVLEEYEKTGKKPEWLTEEHYPVYLKYHQEIGRHISEGTLHEGLSGDAEVIRAIRNVERTEKQIKDSYEQYMALKGKQKTVDEVFPQEERDMLDTYEQKEMELMGKEKALEDIREKQRRQDRHDIQEFFGIHVPLEHNGNFMPITHDEKTGYNLPTLIPQTAGELRITLGKLKSILDKKLASGEIDEATFEMMDDKVSFEYGRMIRERKEKDKNKAQQERD